MSRCGPGRSRGGPAACRGVAGRHGVDLHPAARSTAGRTRSRSDMLRVTCADWTRGVCVWCDEGSSERLRSASDAMEAAHGGAPTQRHSRGKTTMFFWTRRCWLCVFPAHSKKHVLACSEGQTIDGTVCAMHRRELRRVLPIGYVPCVQRPGQRQRGVCGLSQ